MSKRITRRTLLKRGAFSGALILVGPGLARTYAANAKLGLAHVATAGRGRSHLAKSKGENCVALCEVDRNRVGQAAKTYPKAKVYQDYRKMFDELHGEIDAVIVATPDHHHAPAAVRALRLGKHCYCEKPLTWSIHEARVLADETRKARVATQMGNQGHANEHNRLIVEHVRAGIIGDVKEVHTWTNRPVWPQGIPERPPTKPVPEGLDWDLWCGPAPYRDYHDLLHPFKWRGWIDFGCGAVGDMGCHTWDCVWWAMDPDAPLSAECIKAVDANTETFPKQTIYRWEFPAKGDRPAFTAYWYEGGLKPECPPEIAEDTKRHPDHRKFANAGNLFIGTKGKLYAAGDYGGTPQMLGVGEYERPEKTIPRSPGHSKEWLMACRGEKPWDFPKSNFLYGGPLVEAMSLGNVALLAGSKITWDARAMKVTNNPEANRYIRREYRKGWEI